MEHIGWAKEDGRYFRTVGQFILLVQERPDGYYWAVDLPGDLGDRDRAYSLADAITAAEEAMTQIVDELFDEITMHETN